MFLPKEIWTDIVNIATMKNLWVVYIIKYMGNFKSRGKCIGLFKNEDRARAELLRYLIGKVYLFDTIVDVTYRDAEPDDWNEYNWDGCGLEEDITQTFVKVQTAIKEKAVSKELFDKCIEKYGDSYHAGSWDYTINFVAVNSE